MCDTNRWNVIYVINKQLTPIVAISVAHLPTSLSLWRHMFSMHTYFIYSCTPAVQIPFTVLSKHQHNCNLLTIPFHRYISYPLVFPSSVHLQVISQFTTDNLIKSVISISIQLMLISDQFWLYRMMIEHQHSLS